MHIPHPKASWPHEKDLEYVNNNRQWCEESILQHTDCLDQLLQDRALLVRITYLAYQLKQFMISKNAR